MKRFVLVALVLVMGVAVAGALAMRPASGGSRAADAVVPAPDQVQPAQNEQHQVGAPDAAAPVKGKSDALFGGTGGQIVPIGGGAGGVTTQRALTGDTAGDQPCGKANGEPCGP